MTGARDKTARLWDVATGRELRTFTCDADVHSAVISPDGKSVLTGGNDGTVCHWDATTGRKLHNRKCAVGGIDLVAFSPDGQSALSVFDDHTLCMWDLESGNDRVRYVGHTKPIEAMAIAADGKTVLTCSEDGTSRLWELTTGKQLQRFDGSGYGVGIAPDGRSVLIGNAVWDVGTGRIATTIGTENRRFIQNGQVQSKPVGLGFDVALSPDGSTVLTGDDESGAQLFDAATGKLIRRFVGESDPVNVVAVAPDGRTIVTGGWGDAARLWDVATGKELRRFPGHDRGVDSVAFSADGRTVMTSGSGTRFWDVATGKLLRHFEGHGGIAAWCSALNTAVSVAATKPGIVFWNTATGKEVGRFKVDHDVRAVALSTDGLLAITSENDGTVRLLWDVAAVKELRRLRHTKGVDAVALAPDLATALTGGDDHVAYLWDVASGRLLRSFVGHTSTVHAVAYSADGKTIVTGSDDYTARVWNAADGKELQKFVGHTNLVYSVAFTPDDRVAITASWDDTTRLWDVATGKELCKLVSFRDGSWAVADAAGRFDASNAGEVEGLHWVVGNEPIDLVQLKERYYEPGLLAKLLGFNKEPLRDVTAFADPKLYPDVRVTDPSTTTQILNIALSNRGGGIGRVVVKINGKELTADARGPTPDADAASLDLQIDLRRHPLVMPGKSNKIEVLAYNAEGYLSSRGADVDYLAPGTVFSEPPELWAIVVGVSDYTGDAIDLKFAAKDAADVARALSISSGRLFGTERVHLTLLSTEQTDADLRPTRARLVRALEAAQKAKPDDVLVIYLAGHGVNFGGQDGDFYYLTAEAKSADLTDPGIRAQAAISSTELTELVKLIPAAGRQVLILDTCAAGKFVDKLTEKREVPSSQIRALERVKSRTGLHVLAGCASDSVSYEASRYGQGC